MARKLKFNPNEYVANRNRMSLRTLSRYEGKCVAISCDGRRILTSAKTHLQLVRKADKLGLKRSQYVIESIPDLDSAWIL